MKTNQWFTISDAAKQSSVTAATLRRYEALGLLRPARDSAGRRIYSDRDINAAVQIARKKAAARGSGLPNASHT